MADLNLFLCVWGRETEVDQETEAVSMKKYLPHVHPVFMCVCVYVCRCVSVRILCLYLCLVTSCDLQLCTWGTCAAVCLAALPSFWTLKQFPLSCDRWWDSLIVVILCVNHLNCAFKDRDFGKVIAQPCQLSNRTATGWQACQPTQKRHCVCSFIF